MWDIIKTKLDRWSIEESFATFALLLCVAIVSLAFIFLSSDKNVRYYYLQTNPTSAGISYQVWADIDWCQDRLAFSSNDPELTLRVFRELPHNP